MREEIYERASFEVIARIMEYDDAEYVPPSKAPYSTRARVYTALVLVFIAIHVALAKSGAGLAALNVPVSLLPAWITLVVIRRAGGDALPRSLVVEHIFVGAFLGFVVALIAELVITFFGGLLLFRADITRASQWFANDLNIDPQDPAAMLKLTQKLKAFLHTVNIVKLVAAALGTAYIIAAGVEEFVKWLFARSAKSTPNLTPTALAAAVMATALGIAALEHYFYSLQYLVTSIGAGAQSGGAAPNLKPIKITTTNPVWAIVIAVGSSLLRAALAFPLHVGTGAIIGVAMAKQVILRQDVSVFLAWFKAVAVHGTFDAIALVLALFIYLEVIPPWAEHIGTTVQVLMAIAVLTWVRAELRQLATDEGYQTLNGDVDV